MVKVRPKLFLQATVFNSAAIVIHDLRFTIYDSHPPCQTPISELAIKSLKTLENPQKPRQNNSRDFNKATTCQFDHLTLAPNAFVIQVSKVDSLLE